MKIKNTVLVIISLLFALVANCQHQFYFETFNGPTNTFTINDNQLGINSGNNKWIINSSYTAGGTYPNTTDESITYGGNITGAPNSVYLHIYDSASTYTNDNYNPNDSSTRFAHMTTGICTKSITNINFNFYYLSPSISSYGVVCYSIDGGAWVSTGDTLRNRQKWQYATLTNPAFTNVEDLRFGFLWHNSKLASAKDTSALGLDDISIYGIYDSIAHPITCTFTNSPFSYPVDSCLGENPYAYFSATLTDSTCTSTWYAYMSMPNGSFPGNGLGWYQPVGEYNFNDITQYWYLVLPINFRAVGCYRFMLQRAEYPYLTFIDSICIPFDSCPGSIQAIQPPATLDTNPVCAGSIIDVPFWSTGLYDPLNIYTAVLIDSTGYHTATTYTVGTLPSNVAYPSNAFPPAPGDVVSTIPLTAPAGCNYYLEVKCNTGNRTPSLWGPFCIRHCDIKTNNQESVAVCMDSCNAEPHGYNDTITYNDSLSHYYFGNKFETQLIFFKLFPPAFSAISTGLFGIKVDSAEGHFKLVLHVPCIDTLAMNGINPGVYYLRIIADSSNYVDSSLGSLVQITIGEPADNMNVTFATVPAGTLPPYCAGQQFIFSANPTDHQNPPYNSTYQWWYTDRSGGRQPEPSFFDQSTLSLTAGADTFVISCQETNYGCKGNIVNSDTIIVLGPPDITKTGPVSLCVGDTGVYSIPFEKSTNYVWTVPAGAHSDTSTNVLKIVFNTPGTFRISVLAVNYCSPNTATWPTVNVYAKPLPSITAMPSDTLCAGTSVTLTASAAGAIAYKWSNNSHNPSITVTPANDTSYWCGVTNRGCTVNDTVKLTVYPVPSIKVLSCIGDSITMYATGAKNYAWIPSAELLINDSIAKGTFPIIQTFTVVGITNGCSDTVNVSINPSARLDTVSNAVTINSGQSIQLSVKGGDKWYWSPSSSLNSDSIEDPVATPSVTTIYTVTVTNSDGCITTDTVTVDVDVNCGIFVPDIFSPNDPNNHNTILYVRSECLVSVDFIIYDRWGNKLFESQALDNGWDGTYLGKPLNAGTFIYYATGKTADGKTLSKKGNVTLIR